MRTFVRILAPLIVLAAGAAVMVYLVKTRPKAQRKAPERQAVQIDAVEVAPSEHKAAISAMGTVQPAETVVVMPEVSGRLVELHPQLLLGGRLKAGEVVARIDPREYELAVDQQKAAVARARFEIQLERGRRTVAEREWKLLGGDVTTTRAGRSLALRQPHLANAKAGLAGAESGLAMAELRVEKTTITAPFDAWVREERVDVGQLVGPQTQLATLVGTRRYWVQASVPLSELRWLELPGRDGVGGTTARVLQEAGEGVVYERTGRVVRVLGDLDPKGRMVRLLVEVENPLETGGSYPEVRLFLHAYVRVVLEGRSLKDVYRLPRTALHDGNRVWLVDADKKLEIREVTVVRRAPTDVYVRGLAPGDLLIVSRIAAPVAGMELAVRGETPPDGEPEQAPAAPDAKKTAAAGGPELPAPAETQKP